MFFRILAATAIVFASAQAQAARARLIDTSFNIITSVGTSTWDDDDLSLLQAGGHDPNRRGFTFQNGELSLTGAVDPFFRGEAHLIFTPEAIEMEEAFGVSTSLPAGLELKAGMFFAEFGRVNPQHPHLWQWQDQPVINGRIFGPDGFRAPGARLSWLAPTPFYFELSASTMQADGGFAGSFTGPWHGFVPGVGGGGGHAHGHGGEGGGTEGEVIVEVEDAYGEDVDVDTEIALDSLGFNGYPIVERPGNANPVAGIFRAATGFGMGNTETKLGASAAYGDNRAGGKTSIYGADAVIKWVAPQNEKGYPFVTLEGEFITRHYGAAAWSTSVDYQDSTGTAQVLDLSLPGQVFHDYGYHASLLWGFTRGWAIGLRTEWASGSGDAAHGLQLEEDSRWEDPGRQDRTRFSPLISWRPTEFSRIRLQTNHDFRSVKEGDSTGHSVWLGYEILWGYHPAHSF